MNHLYYALGGGLGHFTRALRVIEYFDLIDPVVLLVSPQHQQWNLATPENVQLKILPDECCYSGVKTRSWFDDILSGGNFWPLWIDAFPFGLFGEFAQHPPLVPTNHIARILKMGPWIKEDFGIEYQATYAVEELPSDHYQFLHRHSRNIESIELPVTEKALPKSIKTPFTVLTHTGPQAEVDQLIKLTDASARVLAAVAADVEIPDNFVRIPTPEPYYRYAESIISGCGFNTMLETRKYRAKHKMLPFERRFDDQFLRAELRKSM